MANITYYYQEWHKREKRVSNAYASIPASKSFLKYKVHMHMFSTAVGQAKCYYHNHYIQVCLVTFVLQKQS